jgi:hypothetical protein
MNIESIVSALKEQRGRIDQAVTALEGIGSRARRSRPPKATSTQLGSRRRMSAAARKRISEAMKQRWAKWKGKSAPKKTKARPAMSAAARKKLSALMKARWAARKKEKA